MPTIDKPRCSPSFPNRCHDGIQAFYRHQSREIGLPMQFSVFHPPSASNELVPILFYLAAELMKHRRAPFPQGILIDQGLGDKFLKEQLLPLQFEQACIDAGQPLTLRLHEGYDHGYDFISSFIDEHLAFHARILA